MIPLPREVLLGILGALLLSVVVGSFHYYSQYKEQKLMEMSSVYTEYREGKLSKEEALKKLRGTVYELILRAGEGDIDETLAKDEDLRSLALEKKAYMLYEKGKKEEALSLLESIDKDSFNHISSELLRAFILEERNPEKSQEIYQEIAKRKELPYLSFIALGRLLMLRD